ncbi:hypothetical protein Z517_02162 [Fonsecaea pedrosoi CBS 271.37]|uniref:Unplaced genomic scaffold supercont1.2, whole genome shotgun sequence n=1 Tax=Fonsecaea pedrosoi CBS 271.37 TaxID=1442368 RepID=A0A0D2HEP0_9EURO|nr:uncharacterized protein Z517_02162 [Fonsecaea pedrosoi CBS 271.37]KIW82919.1 hypothetical protein Z517_02162 [Fonsecaea pedrosoi CBS 271.37]
MWSAEPTPLTDTVASGDVEKVKSLLGWPAANDIHDFTVQDKFYAMRTAVERDYLWIVSLLLSKGVKPSPFDFCTAVKNLSYPILELMLDTGFDINAAYQKDYPPFWRDAFSDLELVRWLVEHGADPNAPTMFGLTPFTIAVQCASFETIKLLLELGASVQYGYPLHSAVWNNREEEIIKLLLSSGASPNTIEFEGQPQSYVDSVTGVGTPLHVAYMVGNHKLVQLLLEHGADPKIRDTRGRRPAEIHKIKGHLTASI